MELDEAIDFLQTDTLSAFTPLLEISLFAPPPGREQINLREYIGKSSGTRELIF